jgi:antitoxin component YwqK of YwqJK toxin-antitoxin module
MKTLRYLLGLGLLLSMFALQSCGGRDSKGRLLLKNITTSSGSIKFTPMMRADSASVKAFRPDTLLYNGKPYTGGLANYDLHENLLIEGYVKDGLMDSTWKFYYASGGTLMEGKYKNGMDIGLWRSYYGYSKPKITKLYDDYGYMLMRIEYYDNGHIKNYQNVRAPMFGDKERNFTNDQHGDNISMYVEDSVMVIKQGETAERIGKNVFQEGGASHMDIAK